LTLVFVVTYFAHKLSLRILTTLKDSLMPNRRDEIPKQTDNKFSLEENLRQRSYYEKYYEDLAAHATKMESIGQHEIAEEDRAEMQNVSRKLGDLVKESFDNYDQGQSENQQISQAGEAASGNSISQGEIDHQDVNQEETEKQGQDNPPQIEDLPQEDLIPVDKSHFTEEALEAQSRADAQLAADEAAMDKTIKQFYADQGEGSPMESNDLEVSGEVVNGQSSSEGVDSDGQEQVETSSEEQDYDYGYGM
jgi:hypothetical protein